MPTRQRRPSLPTRKRPVEARARRREAARAPAATRLPEHESLIGLASALGADVDGASSLATALASVLRGLQVETWALFARGDDDGWALGPSRGLPAGAPARLSLPEPVHDMTPLAPGDDALDRQGLALLVPIRRRERTLAVLGVGPRGGGYGADEQRFLASLAACLTPWVENGLLHGELRHALQKLSLKAFELHNLFDVSRELSESLAEDAIPRLVATTVMGHFLVSRCGVYLCEGSGLTLAHGRGLRREPEGVLGPIEDVHAGLQSLTRPCAVADLPDGALRRRLLEARLALAVPMLETDARVGGVLAIGERASGMPFSEEDQEVAQTLARQAQAALENARLQRVREQKKRQDRELQIAREIQTGLFPSEAPELAGFAVAGESRPCYEVGGDCYDWIPLGGGRLAMLVADVAGKGTPASLLMASVHAFVHALAGTAPPAALVGRLNHFLFARTQASRFVTLFYAELDPAERRLVYVNAGHVPPFHVASDGSVSRLSNWGPAVGLMDEAVYEAGVVRLEPGELVAIVTDGVTEAATAADREFGDERVAETLRLLWGGEAATVLRALVTTVNDWAGDQGVGDDLTAMVLTALPRALP